MTLPHERTKLKSVSKRHPCPVCEGVDGCAAGADGFLLCRRRKGEQPGFVFLGQAAGEPQWAQYRRADDTTLDERNGHAKGRSVFDLRGTGSGGGERVISWADRARDFASKICERGRTKLAVALGLPVTCLDALQIGVNTDESGAHWTFPEMDGQGQVIGILRRYEDGDKMTMADGNAG